MNNYTKCPKCNRDGSLAVADDSVITNFGPEGNLHIIGCTNCGWNRPSVHYNGIYSKVPLRDILNPTLSKMTDTVRRFS